ncbi:hypothetical protein H6F67_23445 [Microcoleus sp. FACHB-1515]|uniref:hypothetical protein n=1 Tax=Microcoleus sp. FACHB-1515 TaxID=2692821 RepID=UPI001689606F|nr:hypothetical protein [Microcoleus sp. FACHB-1515]MBD2092809.1 hypothetical protein [Microcoleus sp. FACHB-1515]
MSKKSSHTSSYRFGSLVLIDRASEKLDALDWVSGVGERSNYYRLVLNLIQSMRGHGGMVDAADLDN